jgi:hypothetical protein
MKSIHFKKIAFVAVWAASLLLVSQWGHTQTPQARPLLPAAGTVISGDDIGFRFQGFSSTPGTQIQVTGQWMVKIGGTWTPVQAPIVSVKPLLD